MSRLSDAYRNDTKVAFPRLWPRAAVVVLAVLLVSVGALFVRGLSLGLEFEGGAAWELDANGVSTAAARDALRPLGMADARIQTGDDILRVRAQLDETDRQIDEVTLVLAELTGTPVDEITQTVVGASWGEEITEKAIRALIVFFVVIAIYITVKLEWAMAVAALAAVANDMLVTVGFYALFQFEVTSATVIAVLTIMAYSLYDTIVVFDRVKENEGRLAATGGHSYVELMNLSLNQVLMRGINTTITSVVPVLSILFVGSFLLGAVTLQEFGIALLIGILSGVLSTFFIACPLAVLLKERFDSRYVEARQRAVARAGGGEEARKAVREATQNLDNVKTRTQTPADYGTGNQPRGRKQRKRR